MEVMTGLHEVVALVMLFPLLFAAFIFLVALLLRRVTRFKL